MTQSEENPQPITLPFPEPAVNTRPPRPDTFSYLITAAIFFALGFLLAGLLGFSLAGDSGTPSEQVIANAVQATFTALVPTPEPTATPAPIELTYSQADYIRGAADAPVTLVEFSDYRCPYCGRFALQTLPQLLDHYEGYLRFVYRDYPIFGDESVRAAHAAQCANQQGAFWEFHDALFISQASESRVTLDTAALNSMAQNLALDTDAFNACLNDQVTFDQLLQNIQAAYNLMGHAPTPTFLLNGKRFSGALPIDEFIKKIDQELLILGIEPPG